MAGSTIRFSPLGKSNIAVAVVAVLLVLVGKIGTTTAQPSWEINEQRANQVLNQIILDDPTVIKVFIQGSKTSDEYGDLFQDKIKKPFPCRFSHKNPKRSKHPPQSVNRLRPGDIKVVGGIGDSITSGVGATCLSVATAKREDRGYSFTAGGLETWRTVTTVANLLKIFNRKLRGYSTGTGNFKSKQAGLNVAIKFALDDDLDLQAKFLVSKMKKDRKINFENDWKLVFIMIGHNDVCAYQCSDPTGQSRDTHKANIKAAVDYLVQNMPRVFIAIISMIDTTLLARQPNTEACKIITRKIVCPCLEKTGNLPQDLVDMSAVVRDYQQAEIEVTELDEYQNNNTFTVEWMPFAQAFNGPTNIGDPENPKIVELFTNSSITAPDCTHLNQRGMGLAGRLLWNNLLEPVGKKSASLNMHPKFKCPTIYRPFLFTKKNSNVTNYLTNLFG
ncbi:phospholipase B1, membrane-associated-like [Ischnura elegans]|uniref:phospholipase B1, membrane-associated-like n=1 Tax=Ischnura elegans TaxID=197161 RepID=UPI001ED88453|nr:phospholipase B1, membrane-associated-like [Ischnura elegans]